MTATRAELAALSIVALAICASCLVAGAFAGAAYAWGQSADRIAEAREAQAEAALMTLECKQLADRCVCAVAGARCPKGSE
jgi:hypothetical protein